MFLLTFFEVRWCGKVSLQIAKTIMEYFEYFTPLAMILICWLYAKNILMEEKIKNLGDRVKDLENRNSSV